MKVLILGGTAFLGLAIASVAVSRGHDVTCAARGERPAPPGARLVVLDRDDDNGLAAVRGQRWDSVIDVSRQPGQVRRAVRDLDTAHYTFISSANVNADFTRLEQREDAPLVEPLAGDVMVDMSAYGAAKVACEQAGRDGVVSSTIIRSGLIVGPGDPFGRAGYYPWRFAHPSGPDVLVPDDLEFPCAMVDVRDLAAWVVLACEHRIAGTFNATGPTIALGEVLNAARNAAGSAVPIRPVPVASLAAAGVTAWMGPRSLPLWIDDPDWRYFATLDTSAAREHGFTTRPLVEILVDNLAWEEARAESRAAGLTDDEERALRASLG